MRLVRRQIQALHSGGWWEEDDNGHKLKWEIQVGYTDNLWKMSDTATS